MHDSLRLAQPVPSYLYDHRGSYNLRLMDGVTIVSKPTLNAAWNHSSSYARHHRRPRQPLPLSGTTDIQWNPLRPPVPLPRSASNTVQFLFLLGITCCSSPASACATLTAPKLLCRPSWHPISSSTASTQGVRWRSSAGTRLGDRRSTSTPPSTFGRPWDGWRCGVSGSWASDGGSRRLASVPQTDAEKRKRLD